jgi:hypothetical protein
MAERSVEDAAEIQELLIRWRFEYVDDCLERIDEHLRVLVKRSGVGVDEVIAIYEAQEAILRHSSLRPAARPEEKRKVPKQR